MSMSRLTGPSTKACPTSSTMDARVGSGMSKRAIGVEVNKQAMNLVSQDILSENLRTFASVRLGSSNVAMLLNFSLLLEPLPCQGSELRPCYMAWCLLMQVGNRIIKKRIHVRVEHVQPSRCHEEILERIKKNDQLKAEAKAQGKIISTKRQPEGPKPGFMVEGATLETVTPIPYDVVNDLKGGY
ncbi:UNVERIFIED_CONTAM: 60S ribosomal protein L21-1 [Sesamum latifolium]|uniref:60S ribosomal protein L21-1 n=1 Tax=Sesamum latifolium TaxID=2727402 RepID=A0AAW2XJC8_9LAMI